VLMGIMSAAAMKPWSLPSGAESFMPLASMLPQIVPG
jgi:hypothetical protein